MAHESPPIAVRAGGNDASLKRGEEIVTHRTWDVVAFTLASVAAAFLLPAMPQPLEYHDFADDRHMAGVASFLDVISNGAFLLAGIAGMIVTLYPRTTFEYARERLPYLVFFLGVALTGLGSGYYHRAPDNESLFWDRLPMTIAFMSLISAQIGDRIGIRAGPALLLPLLLVGMGSVVYWILTERAGAAI